ncbi:hypothetical protein HHK36_003217 [Tetracentron sinense]|uniref:Protein NDR1-like n=1 Tax=Tetracentron sinense TaxID=13715 RepID=A0A834ZMT5_TETSI|nr:hypothetical protein HHK36_003217 [Tetracentron sinense]
MSESGGCCRCCVSFIFSLGLTCLFVWLSLRPSKPSCSVNKFYVPALNKTSNDSQNTTIYFEIKLANGNKDKGIYYDDLHISLSYFENQSMLLGNATIPKFYQGHKKKAEKNSNVSWKPPSKADSNEAVFRVDLETAVRYKIMAWQTKRHTIRVSGNVTVNGQGTKSSKKGVKLKSRAPEHVGYRTPRLGLAVLSALFLLW